MHLYARCTVPLAVRHVLQVRFDGLAAVLSMWYQYAWLKAGLLLL
jgi:hypothetical protein